MNNKILLIALISMTLGGSFCYSQQKKVTYDINRLLKENKLLKAYRRQTVTEVTDGSKQGLTTDGILWIKNVDFKTGVVDVDLRGRDVFQQSFLGVVFHGIDTTTNDVIYFRPFNFQTPDTLRRKHTVQYISEPDFPWDKLRKEHPLVYENAVNPFPEATAWFHARIVINADDITVYVNHSDQPSLKVKKLNNRQRGLIGLWSSGLPGDFANLVITQ